MPEIVLTADRTVISEYNDTPFYGFMSCAPKELIPDWIYYRWLVPPVKSYKTGEAAYATLSLRKVESCLIDNGFNVVVADQLNVSKVIDNKTKLVCISSIDPLGLAPGSHAMRSFIKGESRTSYEFNNLMNKINSLKSKYGFKTIAGGAGAWQLMKNKSIDHIFVGEAEVSLPSTVKKIINGAKTPRLIKGVTPTAEQIPSIKKPAIAGMIEIARGCGRGCKFCSTTLTGHVRSLSKDKILNDVSVNLKAGRKDITIQSEDFLAYESGKDFRPNTEAVYGLFKDIFNQGARSIRTIHANLASIASAPELIKKLTALMKTHGQKRGFCQPGIETGSHQLMNKLMPGKLKPLVNEEWGEIVKKAFKICDKNDWFILGTIILGLPGETKDDVKESIKVIESIKPYKSAIAPLFFVPIEITSLNEAKKFITNKMSKDHWVLFKKCWVHNLTNLKKVNLGRGPIKLLGNFIAETAYKGVIKYSDEMITGVKQKASLSDKFIGSVINLANKL